MVEDRGFQESVWIYLDKWYAPRIENQASARWAMPVPHFLTTLTSPHNVS